MLMDAAMLILFVRGSVPTGIEIGEGYFFG